MAARKQKWQPDSVRERISAGLLAKRLEDFAFGRVKMEKHQVTAALGLLRKCVPDLAAHEHTGNVEHQHFVTRLPAPVGDMNEWREQYGKQLQ